VTGCEHFGRCSGCVYPLSFEEPLVWQRVKQFLNASIPLISENRPGWRMRAKLAIRKDFSGVPTLGLFRKNSHELLEIARCEAHHPSINRAAALLKSEMGHLQIELYDEIRQTGSLRYAQFFVCRESGLVQLTLVSRERRSAELLAERLSRHESIWHSIWINLHTSKNNAIFGDEWVHWGGELFLRQKIGLASLAFHPAAFSQAHLSLFDKLLERVMSWVKPGTKLLEVYAGAGAISLHLAKKLVSAVLVEENPYAHLSYQASGMNPSFHYHVGDAKEAIPYLKQASLILLDPPRKGIDPELLKALLSAQEKELIYISCSFESFERDARQLLASGWMLQDAAGYWLFPGADHIEMATHWSRNRDASGCGSED